MQAAEYLAKIAAKRIQAMMDEGPASRILLGTLGLPPAVARAIAREVASLRPDHGRIESFVHPELADGDIGGAKVSDATATWHRNHAPDGVRLTLFSVPASHVKSVEQSLAHVDRVDDEWLMSWPQTWASLALPDYDPDTIASLSNVLAGLVRSDAVSDAETMASFALRVADHMRTDGFALGRAVRRALPALRMPRDAGDPRAHVEQSPETAERFFRKVAEEIRPFLNLRDKDGEPLNPSDLRRRLQQIEEAGEVEPASAMTLRALLNDQRVGDGGWTDTQAAAAEVSWDEAERLFGASKTKDKLTFGEETIALFRTRYREDDLSEEELAFLSDLKRDSVRPGEAHDEFFHRHRERLRADTRLFKRWERLVFRKPIETADLAEGLIRLALRARQEADEVEDPRLYVRLRGADTLVFWKEHNTKLCRLLRDRWRGLDRLLAPEVVLDLGRCWTHAWENELKDGNGQPQENERTTKDATHFEFEAFLLPSSELGGGSPPPDAILKRAPRAQMTWRPEPESMMTAFPMDLAMVAPRGQEPAALVTAVVAANRYDRHGSTQAVDLAKAATISDVFAESGAQMARTDREAFRVDRSCSRALAELENDGILTTAQSQAASAVIKAFRDEYGRAVLALVDENGDGLASPTLLQQGELYGDVLKTLMTDVRAQVAVSRIWAPMLRIGVAEIEGGRDSVIVTALHPLRLVEIGVKARQLAKAMRKVVRSPDSDADEIGNYVDMFAHDLGRTYYADVGMASGSRRLLIETRRLADMSLLESPTFGGDSDELADEPAEETVAKFELVTDEYLQLRPHEKSNFSAILLDAESEDLPLLMANSMARRIEAEADLRCDLVLTHESPARLRQVYEQQNRRIGHEIDSALTSEAARNFLSRLRVGIVGSDGLLGAGAKWHDIAVLQDVIARRAEVRWMRNPAATTKAPSFALHVPTAASKRKPFRKGDTTSGVFLTAPTQPNAAQAYVDALHDAIDGRPSEPGDPWVPLQEVEFRSGAVQSALERAHRLANWVMTFDRLADRRLVATEGRRIIRYFSDPRSDHNVIVSTEITEKDIGERLRSDLEGLLPAEPAASIDGLVKVIHRNSADLSGAIVMRGAHSATHAQELLGLVVAQREVDLLLASTSRDRRTAWFFLDDFYGWLDLSKTRADILAVDLADTEDGPKVRLVVCEAKFVSQANVGEQRRRSLGQLEDTYEVLRKRLIEPDGTVDRPTWLGRLADLVLEHIAPFEQVGGIPFAKWIADIRAGAVPFEASGHSIVMLHDLNADPEDQPLVPDEERPREERRPLAQWNFGRPSIGASLKGMLSPDAQPRIHVPEAWPTDLGAAHVGSVDMNAAPPTAAPCETASAPADEQRSAVVPQTGATTKVADVGTDAAPDGWRPEVHAVISALSRPTDQQKGQEWLSDQVARLRRALQKEGMDAPVEGARLTPNTGLVHVGGVTVTVSWLERKQTDLLTRYGIDIVRITPQPGRIALALRRPERSILHLADAWLRRRVEPSSPERNMALVVGEREDDGELFYLSLAADFMGQERAAPHTLVSGTTGSGKGILTTNLILDVCAFNDPKSVDVHLIDPKRGADYVWARRMPHLKSGIVEEKDAAVALLRSLVAEMEDRYRLITAAGCANIDQFNRKQGPSTRLPRVVIFFDEVANWMQDDEFKDEVDGLINEIATKSRAAGLHLFMIYQRADNQVMTMQLRTNLGNKLILRLGDEGSSRIALGERGAEKLLGKGHIIAKLGTDGKTYGQVPFIGEDEIMELAEAIERAWASD